MAKNMTRKSLAIGAAVALGGSLFAAAPAHAVTSLTISPGSGTSYNTILGSSLNLSAVLVSDDVTHDMIKWKIDGIESDKLITETRSVLTDSEIGGYETAREIDYGTTTFNRAVTVWNETTAIDTADSESISDGYRSASGSVGSTAGLDSTNLVAAITSVARDDDSNTSTIITTAAHGFITGDDIVIDASNATYDGTHSITVVNDTTFTFTDDGADDPADAGATGTATRVDKYGAVEATGATEEIDDGDSVFINDYATPGATDDTFTVAPYAVFDWEFPNTQATVAGATAYEATVDTTPATIYENFIDGHYNEDELAQLKLEAVTEAVEAETTLEFTVQAWIDSTPNNQIDPGETVSVEETVKFLAFDDVVATTTVVADLGENVTVNVVTEDLNNEQNPVVPVSITRNGTSVVTVGARDDTVVSGGATVNVMDAVFDPVKGYHTYTGAPTVVAGVYRAQAYTDFLSDEVDAGEDGGDDAVDENGKLGAQSGTDVVIAGSADVDVAGWDAVNNANVSFGISTDAAKLRTGETVELAYEVSETIDGVDFGLDGVNVRFTIDVSEWTIDSDSEITVGEEVVDQDVLDLGEDIVFYGVTNDEGLATISVSGGVDGDEIEIIADYEGETAYAGDHDLTATFEDSAANALFQLNSLSGTDEILVDASEEVTLSFVVHDQFSTPFLGDDFEIKVVYDDEDGDTVTDYTDELSGGLASYELTAPSEAGSFDITASVYDNSTSTTTAVTLDIDLNVTDGTPTTVTVTGDKDSVSVAGVPLGAYDNRIAQPSPYADAIESSTFTVEVRDEFGVPMEGQTVTVSAAGVAFTAATATAAVSAGAVNTFSAETDENGDVIFTAYSNTAAEELMISVTAGAVSEEAEVTFTGISTVFPGSGLSLDVPETVMSGTANDVVVTLTDALGNPIDDVQVTLDATGVGYLQDEVKTTNSQGQINTKLIIGSNESGSATITATVVLADDPTTPADEDGTTLTVAKTISVGYGSVSAWTKDMGDGTAKVYVKFPTIGEKVRIGHQTGGSGSYETIFVKTIASQTDSALTVNANGSYIVRTIDLEDINRIRVTVGDDTLVQVRYNQ